VFHDPKGLLHGRLRPRRRQGTLLGRPRIKPFPNRRSPVAKPLSSSARLSALSDADLVREAKRSAQGDTQAFAELVRRYEGRIGANCLHISGSPDDVPDLKQEVFVRAYFGLTRFEERAKFSTWLWRIKINRCLRFVQQRKRMTEVDFDDAVDTEHMSTPSTAESRLISEETAERVGRVLLSLPDGLRIPLVLRDMDGLSYEEVGATLDLGPSATKMRIRRARAAFRNAYSQAYPDEAPV